MRRDVELFFAVVQSGGGEFCVNSHSTPVGLSIFATSYMPSKPADFGSFNVLSIERQGEPDPVHVRDFVAALVVHHGRKGSFVLECLHSLQKGSVHRNSFDGCMFGAWTKAPFLLLSRCLSVAVFRRGYPRDAMQRAGNRFVPRVLGVRHSRRWTRQDIMRDHRSFHVLVLEPPSFLFGQGPFGGAQPDRMSGLFACLPPTPGPHNDPAKPSGTLDAVGQG